MKGARSMTEERRLVSREELYRALEGRWPRTYGNRLSWAQPSPAMADAIFAALPQPATEPDPVECAICGDYSAGGVEVHEGCLPQPATEPALPLKAITGTLFHRAWLKSGRPDPLLDGDAWDGFALTVQALAEVEGLAAQPSAEVERLRAAIDGALHELGVPDEGYPTPVANAVDILSAALAGSAQPSAEVERSKVDGLTTTERRSKGHGRGWRLKDPSRFDR